MLGVGIGNFGQGLRALGGSRGELGDWGRGALLDFGVGLATVSVRVHVKDINFINYNFN